MICDSQPHFLLYLAEGRHKFTPRSRCVFPVERISYGRVILRTVHCLRVHSYIVQAPRVAPRLRLMQVLHCQVRSCLHVTGYKTDLWKLPLFNKLYQGHRRASSKHQAALWIRYLTYHDIWPKHLILYIFVCMLMSVWRFTSKNTTWLSCYGENWHKRCGEYRVLKWSSQKMFSQGLLLTHQQIVQISIKFHNEEMILSNDSIWCVVNCHKSATNYSNNNVPALSTGNHCAVSSVNCKITPQNAYSCLPNRSLGFLIHKAENCSLCSWIRHSFLPYFHAYLSNYMSVQDDHSI